MSEYLLARRARMMGTVPSAPPKEKKAIAKVSEKRKVEGREYRKIVKEMLAENKFCQVNSPVCTKIAQGLDHIQKRTPANYLDRANLQRSCNACNQYKEEHPEWAEENGKSKSKFNNNP